jgi:hypothetical protein
MKEKSKLPVFMQVVIGIILGQLIITGLIRFIYQSGNPPSLSKNPVIEAEINQTLGGVVNGLQSYHVENGKFPKTYNAILGPYSHPLDYHSVEISPIDNTTAVFQILPKIPDLYAFSGMVMFVNRTIGYQVIVCQSEQPSQAINFPEIISQCPSNTRIFER